VDQTNILKVRLRAFEEGLGTMKRTIRDMVDTSKELERRVAVTGSTSFCLQQILPRIEYTPISPKNGEKGPDLPVVLPTQPLSVVQSFLACEEYQKLSKFDKPNISKVQAYSECLANFSLSSAPKFEEAAVKACQQFSHVTKAHEVEFRKEQLLDSWRLVLDTSRDMKSLAVNFLEAQYLKHVDRTIAQFPRDAVFTEKPSIVERIKAFVRIVMKRLPPDQFSFVEYISNVPIFAVLFYLVRSGHKTEASRFCQQSLLSSGLKNVEFMASFLDSYVCNALTPSQISQLLAEYNRLLLVNKADYFYLALLKLIGQCDCQNPLKSISPSLVQTIEDWLWFHIQQLDLGQVRKLLIEQKIDNTLAMFQSLLLVGLYAKALNLLWATEFGKPDALHMTVVLLYLKKIAVDNAQSTLFSDIASVNLNKLLVFYLHVFVKPFIDPRSQVHYASLCDGPVRDEILVEIIVSSDNCTHLLGDGSQPGIFQHLLTPEYCNSIIKKASETCLSRGLASDSFRLLNLCGLYNEVVLLVCKQITSKLLSDQLFDSDTISVCRQILDYYCDSRDICMKLDMQQFQKSLTLLRLVEFYIALRRDKDYERALSILALVGLLPLNGDILEALTKIQLVNSWHELVFLIPGLVLGAMTCLFELYLRAAGYSSGKGSCQASLQILKDKAKCLLTFSSLIEHTIPHEVLFKLSNMEAKMI
jgi:nuclear pore complex protein Nup93